MSLNLHLALLSKVLKRLLSHLRDLNVTCVGWLEMTNKRPVPMGAVGWLKGHLRGKVQHFQPLDRSLQDLTAKEIRSKSSMPCLSDISSQGLPEPCQQNSSVSSIHLWFLCSPHSLTRDSHFIQGWQTDFIYSASSN